MVVSRTINSQPSGFDVLICVSFCNNNCTTSFTFITTAWNCRREILKGRCRGKISIFEFMVDSREKIFSIFRETSIHLWDCIFDFLAFQAENGIFAFPLTTRNVKSIFVKNESKIVKLEASRFEMCASSSLLKFLLQTVTVLNLVSNYNSSILRTILMHFQLFRSPFLSL